MPCNTWKSDLNKLSLPELKNKTTNPLDQAECHTLGAIDNYFY